MLKKLFMISALLLLSVKTPLAHPPLSAAADMAYETGLLTVEVLHPVSNPASHYIKEISVKHNGETAVIQSYTVQVSSSGRRAAYILLPVNDGDFISVTAVCSVRGETVVEKTIRINPDGEAGKPAPVERNKEPYSK